MKHPVPWRWRITARTLIVRFPAPYRTLGWAPLGGGYARTRLISNHQVDRDNRRATEFPAHICAGGSARSNPARPPLHPQWQ
ncbi:MAG: hypothetical protein WAU33_06245 [Candidatus Binataceae bacterium]